MSLECEPESPHLTLETRNQKSETRNLLTANGLIIVLVMAWVRQNGESSSINSAISNRSFLSAQAPLLAPNEAGYASIFTMPISLLSATVFNEAMWQRVWAAESPKALYRCVLRSLVRGGVRLRC